MSLAQDPHQSDNRLAPKRQFIRPQPNDDWQDIAQRALPDVNSEEAVSQLQSWNFHVFMRPAGANGSPILPSDVIFVEAPRPA